MIKAPTKSDYIPGLDAARFVACIGVITIHVFGINPTCTVGNAGRFAVPFFACTTVLLIAKSLKKNPERSFVTYSAQRFSSIYVPFLIWTLFYLLARDLKLFHKGNPPIQIGSYLLFNGSAHHLWFLPFILIISWSAFFYLQAVSRFVELRWLIALVSIILGFVISNTQAPLSFDSKSLESRGYIISLGWRTMPVVFWSLGLSLYLSEIIEFLKSYQLAKWLAMIPAIGFAIAAWINASSVLLANLAGIFLLILALGNWSGQLVNLGSRAGKYSYGIYLSHVAWVMTVDALLIADRNNVKVSLLFFVFVISVIGSLLTSIVISKFRFSRWLTP